jgi:hypothetical protein
MNITEEQLVFLKENNIPLSKVFDATNQKREVYRKSMKALEKLIAINATPCSKYGHTIRTRNGHCCQCNTASIAYIKRHYANGYVYIVGSQENKVLKVLRIFFGLSAASFCDFNFSKNSKISI